MSTSFDGNAAAARAVEFATNAGSEVDNALIVIADAKQDMAGGPVRVMLALRHAFGDQLDTFPRPGEKEGNNRDEISVEETINGETKSRKTQWYTVFADTVPAGANIVKQIEYCERAGKSDTVKTDIPAEIMELAVTGGLGRKLDYLKGRRGTFRASIKKAMELVFQFAAVAEVTGIQCEPIWEDGKEGEEIIAAQKCIAVWQTPDVDDKGNPKPVKYHQDMTVGNFLRLNADVATEKGGGFKNLVATLERGKKASDNEGAKPDRRIATLDTMVGVVTELHRYVDELVYDKDQANYNRLVKGLRSNKATDEVVSSFVELRDYLNDIIGAAELEERHKDIVAKVAKAA